MGKETKSVVKQELFQRINFLYQAAHTALQQKPEDKEQVRAYSHCLKAIAQKQVLRLDPNINRTICRKCYMLLVPGITCSVRLKARRQPHRVVTCLECRTVRRFVTNKDYKLWNELWESTAKSPAKNTEKHDKELSNSETLCNKLRPQAVE